MSGMGAALEHVMVVGGTPSQWASRDDDDWAATADRLGFVAAEAGARWLTVRPYGPDAGGASEVGVRWTRETAGGRCTVIVDGTSDGRIEFARAAAAIPSGVEVDERSIDTALYAPADVEPDLILILGAHDHLPPSLVWELAYAELVYSDTPFGALGPEDLAAAIDEFHGRSRRFGGLGTS
jgi:Putative undecaprenyl diphosphate synthase